MGNRLVELHRAQIPNDPRSDDQITLDYWNAVGPQIPQAEFPDFHADVARLTRAAPRSTGELSPTDVAELFPRSLPAEFATGLARGTRSLASTAVGGLALGARAVETALDTGHAPSEFLARQAQDLGQIPPELASTVPRFEDIRRPGDTVGTTIGRGARYLAGGAGEVLPSVAEAVLTGLAGAAAGTAIEPGGGTIVGALGGFVERQAVKKLVAKGITDITTEAGKKALKAETKALLANYAGVLTSTANSYGLNAGEIYNDLSSNPNINKDDSFNVALLGGGIAALPDTFLPAYVVNKFFKGVAGTAEKEAVHGYLFRLAKESGLVIPAEGFTEAFQEYVAVAANKYADPTLRGTPLTEADKSRILNAGVLGAVGGGIAAPIAAIPGGAEAAPTSTTPKRDKGETPPPAAPAAPAVAPVAPVPAAAPDVAAQYAVAPAEIRAMAERNVLGNWSAEDGVRLLKLSPAQQALFQAERERITAAQAVAPPPAPPAPAQAPTQAPAPAAAAVAPAVEKTEPVVPIPVPPADAIEAPSESAALELLDRNFKALLGEFNSATGSFSALAGFQQRFDRALREEQISAEQHVFLSDRLSERLKSVPEKRMAKPLENLEQPTEEEETTEQKIPTLRTMTVEELLAEQKRLTKELDGVSENLTPENLVIAAELRQELGVVAAEIQSRQGSPGKLQQKVEPAVPTPATAPTPAPATPAKKARAKAAAAAIGAPAPSVAPKQPKQKKAKSKETTETQTAQPTSAEPSPIFGTIDFDGNAPLGFETTAQGVTEGVTALAPVYFEGLQDKIGTATEGELEDAGLVSRASVNGDVPHGNRNVWTHRWTAFLDPTTQTVTILPTYKSESKGIMAAETGRKQGTRVASLIGKKGLVPIASWRATEAVHALEAAKPVMSLAEFEKNLAAPARLRMAALKATASAIETGMEPTAPAVIPVQLVLRQLVSLDIWKHLTEALANQANTQQQDRSTIRRGTVRSAVINYIENGTYGKELAKAIETEVGDSPADDVRAIIDIIVGAYNDAGSGDEFATTLSSATASQRAGGSVQRQGVPAGGGQQPAAPAAGAVQAQPQNPGVAPGPGSQPKFRIAGGGYTNADIVRAKFHIALNRLALAGADVTVFQRRLDELYNEFFSKPGYGVQDQNLIAVIVADLANPHPQELITVLHEAVHWLERNTDPTIVARAHRAIQRLSDSLLGLEGEATDPRARLSNPANLAPEILASERLAESLALEGFDPLAAQSLIKRIIRLVKQLYLRVAMAAQQAFFGESAENDARALEFFRLRMQSLMAGDPVPQSITTFLGGANPSVQRQVHLLTPAETGWNFTVFDWETGRMRTPTVLPSTTRAVVFNVHSAIDAEPTASELMERKPSYVGDEPVGGEGATITAGLQYAGAKHAAVTLQAMLDAYTATGHNLTATGQPAMTIDGLTNLLAQVEGNVREDPRNIMAGIQEELTALSATAPGVAPVNPDLSIDGPVTFNNNATRQQSRAVALKMLQGFWSNLNNLFDTEIARRDVLGRKAARLIDRQERLAAQYESHLFIFEAYKEAIRDLIAETKANIRSIVADAKRVGMLTRAIQEFQTRVDDPIPLSYEHLIDRMSDRILSNVAHFTQFLQDTARMGVNWQSTIPQIRAQLTPLLASNPLFGSLNSDEQNTVLALAAAFGRENDSHIAWLEVRASNDHEARDAIRAMLNEARKDTTADLNAARKLLDRVPRKAFQAQRILDRYLEARKQSRVIQDEQLRNRTIIEVHEAAAPVLKAAMNNLERELDARRTNWTDLTEGALLPYVDTPTDTVIQIENANQVEFKLTGDHALTPNQVHTLAKNYRAWVEANRATGGALVNTLEDLANRLDMIDAKKEHVGIRQTWLARVTESISDAMFHTGTKAGQRAGKSMTDYSAKMGSIERALENAGYRVEAARGRAMKALGVRNHQTFKEQFSDAAFGYFEKRRDLMEQPNARELAFAAWRARLQSNPAYAGLITAASWEKLRAYYEAEADYNGTLIAKNKLLGNRVLDQNLGLYRSPIGDPIFTMARGISGQAEIMFHDMRDAWNGTTSDRLKATDVAQQFVDDPDALRTELAGRFTPAVWRLFVKPMATRPGRSLFSGRMYAPAKWTIAKVENVEQAFNGAGADPVAFAVRLHELEANTPDTLPLFVGETLETFQNYFNALERMFADIENGADKWGMERGVPRFLMDARVSEDFPTQWLNYQHHDQNHARLAAHRMSFHAAFGRDGHALVADFNGARDELRLAADKWDDYQRRAREENPTLTGRQILKAAAELARNEGGNVSLLENARTNLAVVDKTQGHTEAWFKTHAEDLVEARVLLEGLSFITSLLVQGPKTALINTMDLTGGPFINFGLSRQALRMLKGNWSGFWNGAFGSLLNTVGVSYNRDSEAILRLNRLGYGDPDNTVARVDRMAASWNAEIPGGLVSRNLVRLSRTIKAGLASGIPQAGGAYTTLKPAPFSVISRWMNEGFILSHWRAFQDLAGRAIEYYRAHPALLTDPDFRFTADVLGYKDGILFADAASFKSMTEALGRWGMRLETVAHDALKPGAPMFTDAQYQHLAEMALEEMSLESSPNTAPRWAGGAVQRFALPLLRWSFARTNQLRKSFREPNGEASLQAWKSGLKAFTIVTGVGIGYALLAEKYDEKLLGKRSNIRGFGQDSNFLAFLEMNARMGGWGLWGDMTNTAGNLVWSGDLRTFSLDNRVVFANSLLNAAGAVTTWARQGEATYATVYRQLLSSLGGAGYLQIAQIINNTLSLDNAEARVTARINVNNSLRAAGREMGMDVRIGRGAGPSSVPTLTRPWVSEMLLASYADDHAGFLLSYQKSIEAAREDGREDPVDYVRRSFQGYNPLRTTFITMPSESEYRRLLQALPDSQRQAVQSAVQLYNKYGATIGLKPSEGRREKSSAATAKPATAYSGPRDITAIRRRALSGLYTPTY